MIRTGLVVLFLSIVLTNSPLAPSSKRSGSPLLYSEEEDGVIELDHTNVHQLIGYSNNPWVVVFYAHWCGHCVAFTKVYRMFKKEVQNWNVYVGALNCAFEMNNQVCVDFKIEYYPTVKFFPCMVNSTSNESKIFDNDGKAKNVHSMRLATANFILSQKYCFVFPVYFPNFGLELWSRFKSSTTPYQVMIIVIGSEVHRGIVESITLDLAVCNRVVVTLLDINKKKEVSLMGSFKDPIIVAATQDGMISVVSKNFDDYMDIRSRLVYKLSSKCSNIVVLKTILHEIDSTTVVTDVFDNTMEGKDNNNDVHMTDIISGISMSLRREIPRKKLQPEDFVVISDWVDTLYDCLPWSIEQKEFLHKTKQWMVSLGPSLDNDAWNNFFKSPESLLAFPREPTWVTCKGMSDTYRGYPCSLWLSFHVITVGCEAPGRTNKIDTVRALSAIKGFVVNYFGCLICREHFKEISKNLDREVKSSREGILWLWHRHNLVNARIRKDISADPLAPKVQYPPSSVCPECLNTSFSNTTDIFTSNPGYEVDQIRWSEASVLSYLRSHYGSGNIRLQKKVEKGLNRDLYDPSVEYARFLDGRQQ